MSGIMFSEVQRAARSQQQDTWQSGSDYESFMGRWSNKIAKQFITWLAIPKDHYWLDVGCGTGTLSEVILNRNAPEAIHA
ncbi:MAG: class I SAM-dependent methyltransferase, partial [Gammaproteobacteria bacterium]|nr:class I SAM-dependent methyltransferase [Gammaproteobacteria bacterium]